MKHWILFLGILFVSMGSAALGADLQCDGAIEFKKIPTPNALTGEVRVNYTLLLKNGKIAEYFYKSKAIDEANYHPGENSVQFTLSGLVKKLGFQSYTGIETLYLSKNPISIQSVLYVFNQYDTAAKNPGGLLQIYKITGRNDDGTWQLGDLLASWGFQSCTD